MQLWTTNSNSSRIELMDRPAFEVVEENKISNANTLIIDKKGLIGIALAKKIKNLSSVVLVSFSLKDLTDVIFVQYKRNIPSIPEGMYSHIFVVYRGEKEILESIDVFIKEAEKSKAKFIFILHLQKNSKNIAKEIASKYKNASVIFYGDLFGPDYENQTEETSIVNDFLHGAKVTKKILIPGNGTEATYPVLLEDTVSGILEVAFGISKPSGIFLLFQKHAPTCISLAHIFHKIDPELKVDFDKRKDTGAKGNFSIPDGEYILEDNYPLEEKIKQVLEKLFIDKPLIIEDTANLSSSGLEEKKNSLATGFLFSFLLFIAFAFIFPVLLTFVFSLFGVYQLNASKNAIKKGDIEAASKSAYYANKLFGISQDSIVVVESELSLIGKKDLIVPFSNKIELAKEASFLLVDITDVLQKIKKTFTFSGNKSKENFVSGLNSLKKTIAYYQKTKAEGTSMALLAKDIDPLIHLTSGVIDVLPALIGFDGEKRYLVLFQNNMELRPGGGFIGSYGILTMNNGQAKDFSIHDVYEADGQLKGHIEPPFPIRRYIPLVHLYLRDSNFNTDFAKGASTSAFLLNQETGQMVDGVIGVDISFVKNLLKETGPIFVSDYNETVTSDNLYMLTQTHAEKNFFPGSTQKKDFLRSLFNSIQLNLSGKKNIPAVSIVKAVGESILQKHVLFAFSDQNIQNLFTINGMSSAIRDNRTDGDTIINDFLGINEANIGVNKANYFIRRKISQNVFIENDGKVSEKVSITYKNTATKDAWPGGDYKNYLRFILPKGANLLLISINGKEQKTTKAITDPATYEAKNFYPPKELEVERVEENGKTIYGFLIIAPINSFTTITASYDLPGKISLNEPLNSYDLMLFKQPGTEDDLYNFSLSYPDDIKMLKSFSSRGESLINKEGKINYSTKLTEDINFRFNFTRK